MYNIDNSKSNKKDFIKDFFDINNQEHLKAYLHFQKVGCWPKKFIPEDVEISINWYIELLSKFSEAWIKINYHKGGYSGDSEIQFNFPVTITDISERKQLEKIQEEFMEFLTAKNELEKYREWIDFLHCSETYTRTMMDMSKLEDARKFVIKKNSDRGYYSKK